MDQTTRFRINLSLKEIEFEGSESFVKDGMGKIEEYVEKYFSTPKTPINTDQGKDKVKVGNSQNNDQTQPFGEYFHTFPSSITQVDKILIAGFYVQKNSSENSFTTETANKLLIEQGIKLSNAAASINQNKDAKRLFVVSKGSFRVSQPGEEYINSLHQKK